MLTNEIAACCKGLKLSHNMVEMADMVQATATGISPEAFKV